MRKWFVLTTLGALCSLAWAQEGAQPASAADAPVPAGYKVRAIMPVFSQLVAFSYPKGFVAAFEEAKNGSYLQESVPKGESVQNWTQMITVTGARGLATQAEMTPVRFANGLAAGYRYACPGSYAAKGLGNIKVGSHEGFAAVISCGSVSTAGAERSESMLAIVVKGEQDVYTLQWAERGPASTQPLSLDSPVWTSRLQQLMPLTLCSRVAGEKPPYPSCTSPGLS